jgi:hypothetical protein
MTRCNLIALLLLIGQILKAQSSDTLVISNDAIKSFFNESKEQISKRTIIRLSDKPYEFGSQSFLEKISAKDSLFTKADIDFIVRQINQRKNSIWSDTLIDDAIFIKSTEIDSIFRNRKVDAWRVFYKTHGSDFNRISFPYFSQDKQTCIIYTSNHCGWLCGEGGIKIFRRKNNVWVLYKTIDQWAS